MSLVYAGILKIGHGVVGGSALLQGRHQWCPSLPTAQEPLPSPALEGSAQYKRGFRSLRWIRKKKSWDMGSTVIKHKAFRHETSHELKEMEDHTQLNPAPDCHSFTSDLLHKIAQIH